MRTRMWCLLLAAAGVGGCDLLTGPGNDLRIEFTRLDYVVAIDSTFPGAPFMTCFARFEARATGEGLARWTTIAYRRYRGLDRSAPADSFLSPLDGAPQWRREFLREGRPDTTTTGLGAYEPFSLEVEFRYNLRGDPTERARAFQYDCGPVIEPSTPTPDITLIAVEASDDTLDVGDTVTVRYRFDGGGPLWKSDIRLSGPFVAERSFQETLVTERERTERFVVPRSSVSGEPIRIRLRVTDAANRQVADSTVTSTVYTDVRPPDVTAATFDPGSYIAGVPSAHAGATVIDDNDLAYLIWQLDGEVSFRDSMPVDHIGSQSHDFSIVPLAAWTGLAGTLSIWARDEAGNLSAPAVSPANAYQFYANVAAPPMTMAQSGSGNDLAYDAVRQRLYFTDTPGAKVRIVDANTLALVADIPLPPLPGALDLSPSGDSLLVTQSVDRQLSVIDLNSLQVLAPVAIGVSDSIAAAVGANPPLPNGVRRVANGKVFVQQHRVADGGYRTIELNPGTGQSTLRLDAGGADGGVPIWWRRMGTTPDRGRLVLLDPVCPRSYVSATDTFSACASGFPDSLETDRMSFDATGSKVTVAGRVFDESLQPVAAIDYPVAMILPDGEYALVNQFDIGIAKVRLADGRIMKRFLTPIGAGSFFLIPGTTTLIVVANSVLLRMDIADF